MKTTSEKAFETAMANPLDKFVLGIRKLIEGLMMDRMAENDKIVTRFMANQEFQGAAFPILAQEIAVGGLGSLESANNGVLR
ncbi:MAG: hypothetical protein PHV70_12540 [Desulfobacteraceae bacterium]|nr:hypothetical protein [Desulfobacteraceae bacterium]